MTPLFFNYILMIITIVNVFILTKKYKETKWYKNLGITLVLIIIATVLDTILLFTDYFLPVGQYLKYAANTLAYFLVNILYFMCVRKKYQQKYAEVILQMNNGNEDAVSELKTKEKSFKNKCIVAIIITTILCFTVPMIIVAINSSRAGIQFNATNEITKIPSNMVYENEIIRFKGVDIYEHYDSDGYTYTALFKADLMNLSDAVKTDFYNHKDWHTGSYYVIDQDDEYAPFDPRGHILVNNTLYTVFMTPAMEKPIKYCEVLYEYYLNVHVDENKQHSFNEISAAYQYDDIIEGKDFIRRDPPSYIMEGVTEALKNFSDF